MSTTLRSAAATDRSVPAGGAPVLPPRARAPAPLDPTFGTSGIALPPVKGQVADALVQPDGKGVVLLVGVALGSMVLARTLPDGTLDPTFGAGGKLDIGSVVLAGCNGRPSRTGEGTARSPS